MGKSLLILITVLYAAAGLAVVVKDKTKWPEALMLLGPVVINIGLLQRL